MTIPLQLGYRNLAPSPALETEIRAKTAKLADVHDRITGVRVVVETPHRRHRQGRLFHVRIDLRVPGKQIVVSREPSDHHAFEDVHVAVRDAFDAAKRQLEDHAREARGH